MRGFATISNMSKRVCLISITHTKSEPADAIPQISFRVHGEVQGMPKSVLLTRCVNRLTLES